jgi:hypothetical protein
MGSTKYLFILVGVSLLQAIHSGDAYADGACQECSVRASKSLEGHLGGKAVEVLAAVGAAGSRASSKESYQWGFCRKFEQAQDTVDVETIFEDMEASGYASSIKEFWTTPACHAPLKNDTNVPILFNTASNTPKNENFPKVVHDYFVEEKNDPQAWLKAINTKTSDGLTFLDFMQYNLQRGYYDSVKESKDAAQRIVKYLCKNGGVYSKYQDSIKCP